MAIVDFYVGGNSNEPAVPHSTGVPHEIKPEDKGTPEEGPIPDPEPEDLPQEGLNSTVAVARGQLEGIIPLAKNKSFSDNKDSN